MSARTVFEISEANVVLTHMNNRLEKHGEEEVLAVDLDFEWETSNACLAMFSPSLRAALYGRPEGAQLELDPDPDHLVSLRFPALAPLKWSGGELTGAQITFHCGVTPKSHIHLDAQKVHKYRLECKEGGTVVVRFQVQCRPTEGQAGKFTKLLTDKQVVLSVAPPDAGGASDDEKK